MVSKQVTITNKTGLHLRPAGVLSKVAGGCKSSVTLVKEDKRVNAKSVLNVMAAQINNGDVITVECDGDNEAADLEAVVGAIESGLGE